MSNHRYNMPGKCLSGMMKASEIDTYSLPLESRLALVKRHANRHHTSWCQRSIAHRDLLYNAHQHNCTAFRSSKCSAYQNNPFSTYDGDCLPAFVEWLHANGVTGVDQPGAKLALYKADEEAGPAENATAPPRGVLCTAVCPL